MVNFKDIGSNPVRDSDFSLPHARDMFNRSFLISSTSLKFTIFLHHKHADFEIADPRSMKDACHTWTSYVSYVALEHPTGLRKIMSSNPIGESRRWILKSLMVNKMRDIFLYQNKVWWQNNNFTGASHFFAIFALLRRQNAKFYGERKQATTNVYFSFWTWIWSLGIQLQEISPTFDKVSGRMGRNNRHNDWKNAKY